MNAAITVGGRIARRTARLAEAPGTAGLEDILWAATDIPSGPYAPFARRIRRGFTDVGDGLPARIQRARILALCHRTTDEEKMAVLACLDAAARRAAYPVMVSDDPRLLRLVELVFDALEKEALS